MKAIRYAGAGRPLEMQMIPVPAIGDHDILVRIKAAGICHSDAHYRSGISPTLPIGRTLGHEVAGVVERCGARVVNVAPGDRVALHYLVTCGDCYYCSSGNEQFCPQGKMIGNTTDGGYAEYIAIPARNAIPLPENVSFEEAATLMCASSTSYHALLKGRIRPGDRVAVYGIGGLGLSAIQLARAFGATTVCAVDINEDKLKLAEKYGAIPLNGKTSDPVTEIKRLTGGRGADLTLELVGLPLTQKQALLSAGPLGRVVLVGLTDKSIEINPYREVLANEVELIGSNDHLLQELPRLMEMAAKKILDTSETVTRRVPLEAEAVNETLDALEKFDAGVRTVIVP